MNFIKNLKNLKIGARLGLGFGSLALLLVILAATSVAAMRWEAQEIADMGSEDLPMALLAAEIDGNLMDEAIEYEKMLRFSYAMQAQDAAGQAGLEKAVAEFGSLAKASEKAFDDMTALIKKAKDDDDPAVVATYADLERRAQLMDEAQTAFEARVHEVAKLIGSGQHPEARALIGAVEESQVRAEKAIGDFVDTIKKVTSANVAAAGAGSSQRIAFAIGLAAAGLALAFLIGVLISRSIVRSLGAEPMDLGAALRRVAEGDLAAPVDLRSGDTTSVMAQVKAMQTGLTQVVSQVRGNAEGVATACAQIAQGNADLSQRTEEQASTLEETAATMNQLGSTVKNNADNARQANQLALLASEVAQHGGAVVGEVVETMKGINESSRKIAEIISTIDGIAFQTNILALNAAVEAARAGEQGRGFAVVAGEVRTLAQRSGEAAREIKTLIGASVERVEQGSALVDKAGTTMGEVVASIRRVTDIVGEITSASNEQATGVNQVGEAITQMDRATQQNAALVEESAAAAESLKGQAQQLVQVVAVFKLAQDAGGAMPGTAGVATAATWGGAERRGPDRAKNVRRAAFGRKAKAAAPEAEVPASAAPAKTGTDDWTSF